MLSNRSVRFSLVVVFWLCATQSVTCQSLSKSEQRQPAQSCYPVDQIIDALVKYAGRNKNANPELSLITAVKRRTVCSRPTRDELSKIRTTGGSDKLIDAIEAAAPPPPPGPTLPSPPPPPRPQPAAVTPKQGRLTVTCALVDCTVFVNGSPIGTTTNKVLSHTMPEGPVVVSVAAKDYDPDRNQEIVDIKDKEPKLISFKLNASRAALEETGAKLFKQMVVALGGDEGLKDSAFIRGKGTLTSYRDGKPTLWALAALIKLPDQGRFNVGAFSGGRQGYEFVRTEGGMELIKMGKGADLDDLNLGLHQLQEYQLIETLKRLQSSSFRIVASDLISTKGEDVVLKAESGSERYLIKLDADMRPREILLELGGLDQGTKLLYSDYTQLRTAFYPKTMQVQRPGAATNGIEVRFDTVELNPPDATTADFGLKKGNR
jgi:hypothetical protein